MRKTAAIWALPAGVVAFGWLRLEGPAAGADRLVTVLALALLPALVGPPAARLAVALASLMLAAAVAFDVSPLALKPFDDDRFFGAIADRAEGGLRSFYDLGLPFDPRLLPEMHGLVLLAIFGFALVLALAVRARSALVACVAVTAGAGWPATLVAGPGDLTRGVIVLAACLFLLAALRPGGRAIRPAVVAGGAVLVTALAATATPAVARAGLLDWQNWNPYVNSHRVSVDYVWRSNYRGIDFPEQPTTVFEVEAPDDARYWRATTLDVFADDSWDEALTIASSVPAGGRDELLGDPTLAPAAANRQRWIEQKVSIKALRDQHLPAAATPVAYDAGGRAQLYAAGGVALREGGLGRGDAYTVWSFAPRPRARSLAGLGPDYPLAIALTYLSVWQDVAAVEPFGSPGREASLEGLARTNPDVARYAPLFRLARRVVGRATTPYAATVALEAWFRSGGRFRYDEQPPQASGVPALVGFVTTTRAGYCQHYAGAMALMLRYLGIPARVAAGFTSGHWNRDRERWIVSDTDAHAWVEVWFPGFGWLPFDPTPSRGTFDAPYSNASATFDPGAAVTALVGGLGLQTLLQLQRDRQRSGGTAVARPVTEATTERTGRSTAAWLTLVLLVALGAGVTLLATGKWARRRVRYLTRDPRRIAAACRRELTEVAADQRVDLPVGATATEAALLLRERLGVDADRFAQAVSAARYGAPDSAVFAAQRAREELRKLRASLRRRLSVVARVRGAVSLRSLRAG